MKTFLVGAAHILCLSAAKPIQPSQITNRMRSTRSIPRRSLIVDTDGAFDDLVALFCLRHESSGKLDLLTTVGGVNSSPANTAKCLQRLFPTVPVTAGLCLNIHGELSPPSWLTRQRAALKLYEQKELKLSHLNGFDDEYDASASLSAMMKTLSEKKDGSVDLLCLGPLTNIASWLRNPQVGPLIAARVHCIYIMGGNNPSLADKKSEYNFEQDPTAASQVLESGYTRDKVFLVPQETCLNTAKKSLVTSLEAFASQYKAESLLARTLLYFEDSLVYDPVAAFCYTNKASCQTQTYHVKVDESTGLMVSTADDSNSSCRIRVATNVDAIDYIAWIREAIQNDSKE